VAGDEAGRDAASLATYLDAEASRADREAAFADLMDRHARRVFAVCLRVLRDHADAEEATQETFVRLARAAEGFRAEAALSTWLYRVAHNVCTDLVRREARRPRTPVADVAELVDLAHPDGDEHGAEQQAEQRAELADLGAALAHLDDEARVALLLVAVDGLAYAEVAEATGVAVGTVKSRVSRARVRLAELLAETDADPDAHPNADAAPVRADPRRRPPARGPP
jgi:RNA polymerase sigma-70 factor, ECF subfamily